MTNVTRATPQPPLSSTTPSPSWRYHCAAGVGRKKKKVMWLVGGRHLVAVSLAALLSGCCWMVPTVHSLGFVRTTVVVKTPTTTSPTIIPCPPNRVNVLAVGADGVAKKSSATRATTPSLSFSVRRCRWGPAQGTKLFASQSTTTSSTLPSSASTLTDRLLDAVSSDKSEDDAAAEGRGCDLSSSSSSHSNSTSSAPATIRSYIEQLESSFGEVETSPSSKSRLFEPLLGLYDVSYTQTTNPNDNPVGGKWTRSNGLAQKLLRTRRTFQHILPLGSSSNANPGTTDLPKTSGSDEGEREEARSSSSEAAVGEAINVVSLEALWGLLRLTVILRGDAIPLTPAERNDTSIVCQPLSPLAVRACFDPPRIVLGKSGRLLNMNVGPRTSVLLDTTYVDDQIRIGMGGTSGTRFVFRRCQDEDDEEANEFRALLTSQPLSKRKALLGLSSCMMGGVYAAVNAASVVGGRLRPIVRAAGVTTAVMSLLLSAILSFSGGGIERDGMSRRLQQGQQRQRQSS